MSCAGTASGIPKFSGTALSTARGRAFGHPLFPPSHASMPNLMLNPEQMDEITEYIISLKPKP